MFKAIFRQKSKFFWGGFKGNIHLELSWVIIANLGHFWSDLAEILTEYHN